MTSVPLPLFLLMRLPAVKLSVPSFVDKRDQHQHITKAHLGGKGPERGDEEDERELLCPI